MKDESIFLPLVEKYYAPQFDDFYVLDHESTDGSIEKLLPTTKVVKIHNEKAFDHIWLRDQVMIFQQKLLEEYDVVCFIEADEFLVYKHKSLKELCQDLYDTSYYDCIKPQGYNLIDGGVVWDRINPILSQKKKMIPDKMGNKILITKKPVHYDLGFHFALNEYDLNVWNLPDFYLVHLHSFDKGVYFERIEQRNTFKFSLDGKGMHNQHTDMEKHRLEIEGFDKLIDDAVDLELPVVF